VYNSCGLVELLFVTAWRRLCSASLWQEKNLFKEATEMKWLAGSISTVLVWAGHLYTMPVVILVVGMVVAGSSWATDAPASPEMRDFDYLAYLLNDGSCDPASELDSDGDGLPDWYEILIGTDPSDKDTDDDNLEDGHEVFVYGCDPLRKDTDMDVLLDGDEVNIYGTDPVQQDSDHDGLMDGGEVLYFGTDPTNASTDGDPYDDRQEIMGSSLDGTPMPAYVAAPGNNVFVAAYPVIDIVVNETVEVEAIEAIQFLEGGSFTETQEYSVSNTTGSSYTIGEGTSPYTSVTFLILSQLDS